MRAPSRGSTTERDGEVDANWPQFRLDRRNTGYASGVSGVASPPTVDWTFDTGTPIWSSPVVDNGVVYTGCEDRNLYAIDAASGEERWRYGTGSPIQGTPAVVAGAVYVGSFDRNVHAVDATTGEKLWRYGTTEIVRSSPTVVDGRVYVGAGCHNLVCNAYTEGPPSGWVYALDATTGDRQWRHEADAEVVGSPAVVDGTVYIGSSDERLYALDASGGEVEWRYETGDWVWSSPSVVDGTVYFSGWDATVFAVDAETGERRWSDQVTADYISGSTAVDDDTLYLGSTPDRGIEQSGPEQERTATVFAFDRETGDRLWRYETDAPEIGSSPVVTDDHLYIGSHAQAGNVDGVGAYALTTDGDEGGVFEVDGRGVGASPAIVDDRLYFGAVNGRVYALS
jgi:outer membrane protein assembly factor BamB